MKNLLGSLLVVMTLFPVVLSKHAQEIDARADSAMLEIASAANTVKSRHYLYYEVKPWSADVAIELRHRLNKLEGVWTDPNSSGPIYVHFK